MPEILQLLDIPPLSTHCKYLKLTTMYNIVANHSYFSPNVFVRRDFPYSTHCHANFVTPFTHTQYSGISL